MAHSGDFKSSHSNYGYKGLKPFCDKIVLQVEMVAVESGIPDMHFGQIREFHRCHEFAHFHFHNK